jgi:lipopolysaccharide/colanic/teichoic acid biosynthesis glycosyltransferase
VSLKKLLGHLGPLIHRNELRARISIRSAEEFRAILSRERARANRNGHEFSLVAFDLVDANRNSVRARRLVHVLSHRVRATDKIGWFGERCIGVVLPYTASDVARKVLHDVCQIIGTGALSCSVYTYPSRSAATGDTPDPQRQFAGASSERTMATLRNPSSSTTPTVSPSSVSTRELVPIRPVTSPGFVRWLDPFFASRVPRWKRSMDIIGALLGLFFLSPLFLLIAMVIKVSSRGPVLFSQERIGHRGKHFICLKFRTMKVDVDISVHRDHARHLINSGASDGGEKPLVKLDSSDDSRITPLGRILRQSCLDELPQLINVLRGEMSLVGPRPCLPYEAEEYLLWQRRRFDAVPGLTGLWQVSGKNKTTFVEMVRLDIAYEEQKSLWLDVRLLLRTLPAIVVQIKRG